jgi:hypothetical protein
MLLTEHYCTWLVIWSCSIRILADTPAVLTEGFYRYTQILQANVVIVPPIRHNRLLPSPFQFIIYDPTI